MYISVDVGGTNTRIAGAQDLEHPTFVSDPIRQRNGADFESDMDQIVSAAKKIGGDNIEAVGIGVTGTIDDAKTLIVDSENNPHWNDQPFVQSLADKLGCPVYMDNDAVAQALGESYYDDAPDEFAYIVWGTGVGGVLVGKDEASKPVVDNINQDWEDYFRAWHMACSGRELTKQYDRSPETFTDAEWETILQVFAEHLQIFIDRVHPKAIIFGGGLSIRHAKALVDLSKLEVSHKVTSFGDDSGLYGGLAVIREAQESTRKP